MSMTAAPRQPTLLPLLTKAFECDFRGRLKVLMKVRSMIGMYGDIDWVDADETRTCGRMMLELLAQRPDEWDLPAQTPSEAASERYAIECLHALGSMLWNFTAVLACPTATGITEAYLKEDCQMFISGVLPMLSYKRDHWIPEKHLRPFFEILNNLSQCPEIAVKMVEQGVIQQMAQCPLALELVPSIMTLSNLVRSASDKKNRMFAFGQAACQRVIELLPYAMADVNIHSGHYVPSEILLALMGMSENEDNIRSCLAAPYVINAESEKFSDVQQRLQFSTNELRLLPLLIRLRNPEGLPGLARYQSMVERTAQLAQMVLVNLSRLQAPLSPHGSLSSLTFDTLSPQNSSPSTSSSNFSSYPCSSSSSTYSSDSGISAPSVVFHVADPATSTATSSSSSSFTSFPPTVDTSSSSSFSIIMTPPFPSSPSATPMSVCSLPPPSLSLELSTGASSSLLSPLSALLSPLPLSPSLSRASTPSTTPLVLETRDYKIMSRLQVCSTAHVRALSELYLPTVICNLLLSYCTPWTDELFTLNFDLDGDPIPLTCEDAVITEVSDPFAFSS